MNSRRAFLKGSALSPLMMLNAGCRQQSVNPELLETIKMESQRKVLHTYKIKSPVKIASMHLLKSGEVFLVRTRSTDGAEGISVTNSRADMYYPILIKRVFPYFIGKDARDLESLIDGIFKYSSNYKLQGQALWCPVAWAEFSILDMLGKISGQSLGQLFGGVINKKVSIYCASGNRQTSAREEADILKALVEKTGAKAVKFKVGGRMSNDSDSIPGRTEKLIPLVRKTLGDDIAIHADSNGSYNPARAIEVGKMLEDINAAFFEEPCPFDRLWDTKIVADALNIPVAGGECESSQRRFRWMIANRGVDVVQPDLHYYGGFIRSTRVARMAAKMNMTITPHMSGGNTGFAEVIQFASFTPNIGPYMEYKGGIESSGRW